MKRKAWAARGDQTAGLAVEALACASVDAASTCSAINVLFLCSAARLQHLRPLASRTPEPCI